LGAVTRAAVKGRSDSEQAVPQDESDKKRTACVYLDAPLNKIGFQTAKFPVTNIPPFLFDGRRNFFPYTDVNPTVLGLFFAFSVVSEVALCGGMF
jgi:hypothetical protein